MKRKWFWFVVAGLLSAFAFDAPALAALCHNHEWQC
jgi:hypothetical protein